MPFEISPAIVNPWITEHPMEARALAELAAYLRGVPDERWYYRRLSMSPDDRRVQGRPECGTVGCALGHANSLQSCRALRAEDRPMLCMASMEPLLPDGIARSFFLNGGIGGVPFPRGWEATQHDVADRIEHWLHTGLIR